MSETNFEATIFTKVGGSPVTVRISANDLIQAMKIIEMRPEFKCFLSFPQEVR